MTTHAFDKFERREQGQHFTTLDFPPTTSHIPTDCQVTASVGSQRSLLPETAQHIEAGLRKAIRAVIAHAVQRCCVFYIVMNKTNYRRVAWGVFSCEVNAQAGDSLRGHVERRRVTAITPFLECSFIARGLLHIPGGLTDAASRAVLPDLGEKDTCLFLPFVQTFGAGPSG